MKRVYNSNMAAIDDSIGVMRAALEEHKAKFGNRTMSAASFGTLFTQSRLTFRETLMSSTSSRHTLNLVLCPVAEFAPRSLVAAGASNGQRHHNDERH